MWDSYNISPTMQHSSPSVESPTAMPQTGGFIALVDDDPHILEVLSDWVQSLGLAACSFECAEDLLDALHSPTFPTSDLLGAILDINLGGMHGVALAQQLRTTLPDIPLVMISALNADEIGRLGPLPSKSACLKKPFDLDALEYALFGWIH
jgi:CheY-like chemotaxis protein